ncbi:hypothetical protein ACFPM2_31965, partial [Azospirillum picis]
LLSLIGPLVVGTDVPGDASRAWEGPSADHWLGLEGSGKDTLHLLVIGGRTVLMVGFLAAGITTVIAVAVGSLAGYFGGRFDLELREYGRNEAFLEARYALVGERA